MFYVELVAPFFVFGPRPLRLVGFVSLVLLQTLIAATGNYGFFNVLSVILCLSLLDDRDWCRLRSVRDLAWFRRTGTLDSKGTKSARWSLPRRVITGLIGSLLLIATGGLVIEKLSPAAPIPGSAFVPLSVYTLAIEGMVEKDRAGAVLSPAGSRALTRPCSTRSLLNRFLAQFDHAVLVRKIGHEQREQPGREKETARGEQCQPVVTDV
jgi:hypothetical protein